ncbi:MAG: adenylosuccinate synthase [Bacillota bacterium]
MGVALVGAQWGDEGKGKMTDYLAAHADMVIRYQGGANAGHTLVVSGVEHKLHLIPSGILAGKMSVIAHGMVVDPALLVEELGRMEQAGADLSLLRISDAAHLIMPYHKILDAEEEKLRQSHRLGTTGRGIGPAYRDKVARWGLRIGDLVRPDSFAEKVQLQLRRMNPILERIYGLAPLDPEAITREYLEHAGRLRPYICDTVLLLNRSLEQGARLLFEGAQGTLLDVDLGTYPYVTSSNPTVGGACTGTGVPPASLTRVIGIAKAYTTRVGDGPFPTELTGQLGDLIRQRGREYGTATGRPRRCGWLDTVVLRHSVRVNGLDGICLTKIDVLSGMEEIRIADSYTCRGTAVDEYPLDQAVFSACRPEYIVLDGWVDDISRVDHFDDLPRAARNYVSTVSELAGVPITHISVGPGREQTLELEPIFGSR